MLAYILTFFIVIGVINCMEIILPPEGISFYNPTSGITWQVCNFQSIVWAPEIGDPENINIKIINKNKNITINLGNHKSNNGVSKFIVPTYIPEDDKYIAELININNFTQIYSKSGTIKIIKNINPEKCNLI